MGELKQTIPVLDLNDFLSGDAQRKQGFIKGVGDSLKDLGFFALENHGVDYHLVEKSYGVAEAFFKLSNETKTQYEKIELKGQRGFVSFGKEHAKDSPAPDLKEFWHVARRDNIWPAEVPEYKSYMTSLFQQLDDCAAHLLRACSLYIGEQEELFADMAKEGESLLRVIHYPPIEADADPASIRAAAHEDINLITLLCESTDEGLELLGRDGTWMPIHALQGQIIVDSGDMIQNLTNGLFKSTTHRVVNPNNDHSRRFSMPFFVHPRPEVVLNPLESCVEKSGGEKRYPDWTAKEYLQHRLKEIGLS